MVVIVVVMGNGRGVVMRTPTKQETVESRLRHAIIRGEIRVSSRWEQRWAGVVDSGNSVTP